MHRSTIDARRPLIGLLCTGTLLIAATSVVAAEPEARSIRPAGGSRGGEVEVVVYGNRLKDTQGMLFYDDGLAVKAVKDTTDTSAKLIVSIDPECPLGLHPLRVRTATGISPLLLFSVGSMPEVPEKEPNDTAAKPQHIDLDRTVNGTANNEEIDIYAVEARKGQRLTAEVEAIRLGTSLFDPYVSILDRNQQELAASDDDPLAHADAVASIVAPEDGRYFVVVRDCTFNAPRDAMYRLHVGTFPQPRVVFPSGGKLGETVKLKLIGDIAGDSTMKVKLPQEPNSRFAVYAQDKTGTAACGNPFILSTLSGVIEAEPNDTNAQATPFEAPAALDGILSKPGDVDSYVFTAKKGQQFDVRVHGRKIRSPIDSVLTIFKASGGSVAGSDDSGNNPDSALRFTASEDGKYTIVIKDMLAQGGPNYVYRIDVALAEPDITASLPELRRYTDVLAIVPKGNRMAIMMNVNRRDVNGDVVLDLENLPEGVTAEAVPVAASQSSVPVLLTAADDAPLGASATRVVPRSKTKRGDTEVAVAGGFEQKTLMLRVMVNRSLYSWYNDRMSTAVTERVPFKIEIIEPKAPLVRNGSMELRVRAIRDEGFTSPIRMRMAFNPPGVSSSGSVTIEEGKDEGIMPLTANKDAEIGDWQITIVGTVSGESGSLEAATQLAKLRVADSFFSLTAKPAAVEQGKETTMTVDVEQLGAFQGKAKLELLGLPNEAVADSAEFDSNDEHVKVKIRVTAKTPVGRHKAVMLRATAMENGEPVVHMQGPAELRVDAPLVKKASKSSKSNEPAKK